MLVFVHICWKMRKKSLKDYSNIALKPENFSENLDFDKIFGRKAPVHIEIGSGKGTFLVSQAKRNAHINFFGVEWANKYYRVAVDRMGRWGLENVRLTRTDAAELVDQYLSDSSVDCFHIYFPDPWPKKRHHKRRFICETNMHHILRCLKTGGTVNIATDHTDYFSQIKEVINTQVNINHLEVIDFIPAAGTNEGEVAGTNYERKYIKDNRAIHTIAARKI